VGRKAGAFSGARVLGLASDDPGEFGELNYTDFELQTMNDRFHARMLAAIQNGSERCATRVSTAACTKFPKNY